MAQLVSRNYERYLRVATVFGLWCFAEGGSGVVVLGEVVRIRVLVVSSMHIAESRIVNIGDQTYKALTQNFCMMWESYQTGEWCGHGGHQIIREGSV